MTPPPDAVRPRWTRHRLIIVAGVLILLVIVAVVALLLGRDSDGNSSRPESGDRDAVAIAYVNAINDGDPQGACELETPRARENETVEQCTVSNEYIRDNHYKADEPRVIRTRELTEGVGVLVEYRVTNNANPQHEALRMMQQPDGAWLVDQVEGVSAEELSSPDPILTVLGETRSGR